MAVTLISFAFFFGIALSKVGLPPMVGFLVAGFAYNLMDFQAPDSLQAVADLGVTLLLFSIGLKLKIEDLATAEVWANLCYPSHMFNGRFHWHDTCRPTTFLM